jgi:hypothetical protein
MTEKITYAVLRRGVLKTPDRETVRVIQEPTVHSTMCVVVDNKGYIRMVLPELIDSN